MQICKAKQEIQTSTQQVAASSSKLVHKSLRIQRKILFENKHKVTIKKINL